MSPSTAQVFAGQEFAPPRRLLGLLLIVAALLSFVPDRPTLGSVTFSVLWFALVGVWTYHLAMREGRFRIDSAGVALVFFFCSVALSLPVALMYGVPFAMWVRAAVPFLFLFLYFMLSEFQRAADVRFLTNALHLASVAWLLKILIVTVTSIRAVLGGEIGRLTFLTMDLTIPFDLVGLSLSLFNPDPRAQRLRHPLGFPFLLVIVATGYRSRLLLAIGVLAIYAITRKGMRRWMFLGAAVATLAAGSAIAFGDSPQVRAAPFLEARLARFTELLERGDQRRVAEVRYAMGRFAESPVWGKGLGYPIPTEVVMPFTYVRERGFPSEVRYIHNLIAYLLMDLGLLGFGSYSAFITLPALRTIRERGSPATTAQAKFGALVAMGVVLCFYLISASFRHIQGNLIVAVLAAILMWQPAAAATPKPREEQDGGDEYNRA